MSNLSDLALFGLEIAALEKVIGYGLLAVGLPIAFIIVIVHAVMESRKRKRK